MISNHATFTTPESAFYEYQSKMEKQSCQVCNNHAAGFHHGAFVCEACKKFFKRYSLNNIKYVICQEKCELDKIGRRKCPDCRFQKCLQIGMHLLDVKSNKNLIDISKIPCRVCGGKSSGFHFGSLTCEGCKGFFRRTIPGKNLFICITGKEKCTIQSTNRIMCKFCRYQRCLSVGMSRMSSRIGRQPNAVKYQCAVEISRYANCNTTSHNIPEKITTTTIVADTTNTSSISNNNNNLPASSSAEVLSSCSSSSSSSYHPMTPPNAPPSKFINLLPHTATTSSTTTSNNNDNTRPTVIASGIVSTVNNSHFNSILMTNQNSQFMDESLMVIYGCIYDAMGILHLPIAEAQSRLHQSPLQSTPVLLSPLYNPSITPSAVWQCMMANFTTHAHLTVSFAKCLPGFCHLPLSDRRLLVQQSMYTIVLLNMARHTTTDNNISSNTTTPTLSDDYVNYFDFSPSEYRVILTHFPNLVSIAMNHLQDVTSRVKSLRVSPVQLAIMCCCQLYGSCNNQGLDTYEFIKEQYESCQRLLWISILDELLESESCYSAPQTSFSQYQSTGMLVNQSETISQPSCRFLVDLNCPADLLPHISRHFYPHNLDYHITRLTSLIKYLPETLSRYNEEHHHLIEHIKTTRPDLEFPELFIEMFQLSPTTTATTSTNQN